MKGLIMFLLSLLLMLSSSFPAMNLGDALAEAKAPVFQQPNSELKMVPENNQPQKASEKLKSSKAIKDLGTTTLPTVPAAPAPDIITEANTINERSFVEWCDDSST